jgi:hypothetical protein
MKRLLVLALLALTLVACGSTANTGTAVTPAPTQPSPYPTMPQPINVTPVSDVHFAVGDIVSIGGTWQITITKASLQQGGQYDSPAPGTRYLVLSLVIKNISQDEQRFFGSAAFTLRTPDGQAIYTTFISSAKPEPSGKVEAGGPLAGDIVYNVPVAIHAFSLSFELDPSSPGQTVWDITV